MANIKNQNEISLIDWASRNVKKSLPKTIKYNRLFKNDFSSFVAELKIANKNLKWENLYLKIKLSSSAKPLSMLNLNKQFSDNINNSKIILDKQDFFLKNEYNFLTNINEEQGIQTFYSYSFSQKNQTYSNYLFVTAETNRLYKTSGWISDNTFQDELEKESYTSRHIDELLINNLDELFHEYKVLLNNSQKFNATPFMVFYFDKKPSQIKKVSNNNNEILNLKYYTPPELFVVSNDVYKEFYQSYLKGSIKQLKAFDNDENLIGIINYDNEIYTIVIFVKSFTV